MQGTRITAGRLTVVAGLAIMLLLPAAGAATTQARVNVVARGVVANCKTSGLVVWVDTQEDATAGSVYYTLKFTNQSGHTCRLVGYPGVSALDLHGHALGSAASRAPATNHVVNLANGSTAGALLRIAEAGNFPASACRPTPAAGLRVYPPNQTASKVVPLPFQACARTGPGYLSVKTVGS